MSVLFGFLSAVFWGTSDFVGGYLSRKERIFTLLLWMYVFGAVVLFAIAPLFDAHISVWSFVWGAVAGVFGVLTIASYYYALKLGPMGIVAPIASVVAAIVPITSGFVIGERPGEAARAGFVIALVGIVSLNYKHPKFIEKTIQQKKKINVPLKNIYIAIGSGLVMGIFLTVIGLTPEDEALWPIAIARAISAILVFIVVLIASRRKKIAMVPQRKLFPLILLAGAFDALGNASFVLASMLGLLSIATGLTSLFPVPTIILAAVFFKERMDKMQQIGVLLCLLAGFLFAID